ncbi:hypothetical protein [Burkholderia cenocepacia]|uniref:hypothetical protein n=1 Tax=Burkholderia cenocepacia TaxID=95486 RepID=UPI00195ED604|nr:hypothetical protein [Burkholderia cenocepacia]MBR8403931.1 hypothetical protein [Burkholderia cenocepacia]
MHGQTQEQNDEQRGMSASETDKSNLAVLNEKIAKRTAALGAPEAAPLDAGDLLRSYTYLPELTHRIEANLPV